jgi:hypothetical protein
VGVSVGTAVGVAVEVGVRVGVRVGVDVLVLVGVAVGSAPPTMSQAVNDDDVSRASATKDHARLRRRGTGSV